MIHIFLNYKNNHYDKIIENIKEEQIIKEYDFLGFDLKRNGKNQNTKINIEENQLKIINLKKIEIKANLDESNINNIITIE